ncbi:MAG: hypothetical protein K1X35_06750 [Caulobacteraceae bacterium]|nr:hypothetical protein [Caulobacteraceae bacterium]
MSKSESPTASPPITEFTIVHFPDGWRILVDGKRWGRFPYRVDAEEAALRLTEKVRAEGGQVRLLAQGLTGEIAQLRIA